MLIKFFEFAGGFLAKKLLGRFLNTKQEIVARILFNEPRFVEFLTTKGSGKSTLFDILEAFADSEDPNYQTRAELFQEIGNLKDQLIRAESDLEALKKTPSLTPITIPTPTPEVKP